MQLLHGDCLEVMRQLEANSVDTIITDPPYGLTFMGKNWDHGVPGVPFWQEALRVAKPGAFLLAFGGSRTYHRLTCAIEDAGWEIRDCIMWIYASGFPKSLDIGKAIDKRRDDDLYHVTAFIGEARDGAGLTNRDIDNHFGFSGMAGHWTSQKSQPAVPTWEQWQELKRLLGFGDEMDSEVWRLNGRKGKPGDDWEKREVIGQDTKARSTSGKSALPTMGAAVRYETWDITAPATDLARQWDGWGSALKPAFEPVVVAMKPLDGTFAANAEKHGVAGLWIDGGRIGTAEADDYGRSNARADGTTNKGNFFPLKSGVLPYASPLGRWPANVIFDEEAGAQLGEASRFFYTPKASRSERNAGLEGMPERVKASDHNLLASTFRADPRSPKGGYENKPAPPQQNHHPTVKPLALMEYLCKLTRTPTGGVVLDPFMGSGSTGVACVMTDRDFIGIEQDAEYLEIARARIAAEQARPKQLGLAI